MGRQKGYHHTEETKRKIGLVNKGRVFPPSYGEAVSKRKKGIKLSIEHRKHIGEAGKGRIVSKETRKKISLGHIGQIPWNKGKTGVYSAEVLKKMSEIQKGKKSHWWGRHLTEEHKKKIGDGSRGEKNGNYGGIPPERAEKIRQLALQRYNDPKWMEQQIFKRRFGFKSTPFLTEGKSHHNAKLLIEEKLRNNKYDVFLEYPLYYGHKLYFVDVVGVKDEKIAVECGNCKKNKLEVLKKIFDRVINIPLNSIENFSELMEIVGK